MIYFRFNQGEEKNVVIKFTSGPVIRPTISDFNKNDLADITVNIIWGNASSISEVLAGSPAYGLTYDPVEGTDYTISDNGDGTGTFVIKKELTNQLPVPINMVPDGAEMVVTIKSNQGEEKNIVIKVISPGSISSLSSLIIIMRLRSNMNFLHRDLSTFNIF
jgi:hypothetical protein